MRFHRPLLYAGAFLVAMGFVLLGADAGVFDTSDLVVALRAWPLAIIGVGLALVLRRTPVAVAGGLAAAIMPGVLLGSAFGVLPRIAGDCGAVVAPGEAIVQEGTLTTPATVLIQTSCGSLTVDTAAGTGWRIQAANTAGRRPTVDARPDTLFIGGQRGRWIDLAGGRDDWAITLPRTLITELDIVANASRGTASLAGLRTEQLLVTSNLSHLVVDATGASLGDIVLSVNMGSLSLTFPGGSDGVGHASVDGGSLSLCAPPDVGIRVSTRERASDIGNEREWRSDNHATAEFHVELTASTSFGSIRINPTGGCK